MVWLSGPSSQPRAKQQPPKKMPFGLSLGLRGFVAAALLLGANAVCGQTNKQSQSFDLEEHWHRPLAEQGEAPAQWAPVERSIAPSDCGQCHGDALAQWQTSRHAHAF